MRLTQSLGWASVSLTCALMATLAGCGGARHERAVVEVGDVSISSATVNHWAEVMARGGGGSMVAGSTPTDQALAFLISSEWLIGEARRRKIAVSSLEVESRLSDQLRAALDKREFEEVLGSTGKTSADLRFEIQTNLAAEKLRRRLLAGSPVSPAGSVARYYERHLESYRYRERRYFDIYEYLPSEAAALSLKRSLGNGDRSSGRPLHEVLERPGGYVPPKKAAAERAIFAAEPGVLGGPVSLNGFYALFRVTRVVPPGVRPLAAMRGAIKRRLALTQREVALNAFLAEWRAYWTARTNCRPGYVVQKCEQYKGPLTPEEDPLSRE